MGRPKGVKNRTAKAPVHRVTTFGKGGNPPQASTEVAPIAAAAAELEQTLEIPVGADAEQALKEIADLNGRVQRAHARFTESAAETKERRESWQGLSEQLQTLIAVKTRKPNLPLFDAKQAEAEHQGMLKAAEQPVADAAEAVGETSGADVAEAPTEVASGAPAAPETVETVF